MTRKISAVPTLLLSVILAMPAVAQVRTFVASTGLDSNPCTLSQPCRNFNAAIAAVASGGEVLALDSAGYGSVNINKPVALVAAPGIHAAIAPTSGSAVVVLDSSPVIVRGLFLKGHAAHTGVYVRNSTAHVERVHSSGFTYGMWSENGTKLTVLDSTFAQNYSGANLLGTSAGLSAARFLDNTEGGLSVYLNSTVSCISCVANGNRLGINVTGSHNGFGRLILERSVISNNLDWGVSADDGAHNSRGPDSAATIWISNSTLTNTARGVFTSNTTPCVTCAQVFTRGNNTVEGNEFFDAFFSGSFPAK